MTTAPDRAQAKASTLVEALPYIRTYRGETVVVKIGGAALDDPALAPVVAQDLALMALVGIRLVVVHGGGPQVSEAMRQAGLEPAFHDGLRVTGEVAMEVVRRVLVGTINPDLVARLSATGLVAVGISGFDARTITATKVPATNDVDLGRVGDVGTVDATFLDSLLEAHYTPVVASVAPDESGRALNVNADGVAGAIASALGAAKLVFLTNVEGLYRDLGDADSLVSEVNANELAVMQASLSSGMRPKVASALLALREGVGKVHILDGRIPHALLLEVFTTTGIGTQVLP